MKIRQPLVWFPAAHIRWDSFLGSMRTVHQINPDLTIKVLITVAPPLLTDEHTYLSFFDQKKVTYCVT